MSKLTFESMNQLTIPSSWKTLHYKAVAAKEKAGVTDEDIAKAIKEPRRRVSDWMSGTEPRVSAGLKLLLWVLDTTCAHSKDESKEATNKPA